MPQSWAQQGFRAECCGVVWLQLWRVRACARETYNGSRYSSCGARLRAQFIAGCEVVVVDEYAPPVLPVARWLRVVVRQSWHCPTLDALPCECTIWVVAWYQERLESC